MHLMYRGGSSGGSWSPKTPGTPLAWFDATSGVFEDTAGTDAAENGDGVACWRDRSGHGYKLVQASAPNRPIYQAAGWNGTRPCLSFDGSTSVMKSTDGGFIDYPNGTNRNLTVFMTCKPTAAINIEKFLFSWFGTVTGNFIGAYVGKSSTGNILYVDQATPIGGVGATPPSATGFQRLAVMAGGGTCSTYVGSVPDMVNESFNGTNAGLNSFSLGDNPAGIHLFNGLWGEIVIYAAKLTPSDFARYRTYSAFKFGG